jgi:hypothetical protein
MTTITPTLTEATIEVVHPGIEQAERGVVVRSRPLAALAHARIGIVENGKWNAGHLLEGIRARLVADHDMAEGPLVRKQHYNRDLTEEELALMGEGADLALAAIGDCGSCTSYTIRDMVNLERAGIPTVAVVTEPFLPLAQGYAATLGLAESRVQPIEHPLYGIDDEALVARITAALEPVIGHVTDRP